MREGRLSSSPATWLARAPEWCAPFSRHGAPFEACLKPRVWSRVQKASIPLGRGVKQPLEPRAHSTTALPEWKLALPFRCGMLDPVVAARAR